MHCHSVSCCANVKGMPKYAFDVRQGCGCVESFQAYLDLAGFSYIEVSLAAFVQIKRKFRKRWCARCDPRATPPPPRKTRTRIRRDVDAQEPL